MHSPFIYTAEVAVRPEVTLGKYMGVTVTKIDTSVSDEEVDAELENQRNKNARTVTVTDRPVAEGDTAVIDFEGFVDGVAFEGGKGENHPLEIGSHTFIDTFEDQLVGKNSLRSIRQQTLQESRLHSRLRSTRSRLRSFLSLMMSLHRMQQVLIH